MRDANSDDELLYIAIVISGWALHDIEAVNINLALNLKRSPGTHEDSMYGTKLETIRSIHSEV